MEKTERRLTRSVNGSSPKTESSSSPSPTPATAAAAGAAQSVKFDLDAADHSILPAKSEQATIKSSLRRSGAANAAAVASAEKEADSTKKAGESAVRTRSQNQTKASFVAAAGGDPDSIVGSLLTRRRSSTHLKNNLSASLGPMSSLTPMETRKRHLSGSSDLVQSGRLNLNESQLTLENTNEDSNSSSVGLASSLSSSMTSSLFSSSKRFKFNKYKDFDAFEGICGNSSSNLDMMGSFSNSNQLDASAQAAEPETFELVDCPIQGCDSHGNLNGRSTRHSSYDACPLYFGMSNEECASRRAQMEKQLGELNRKLIQINENKKNLRSRQINEEQTQYYKKMQARLRELARVKDENAPEQEPLIDPDLLDDIKNMSTTVLLNSITSVVAPTPIAQSAAHNTAASVSAANTTRPPSINDLEVSTFELDLFKDALIASSHGPDENGTAGGGYSKLALLNKENKLIQFGNYEVETWYKSPYPDDFWQLEKIFICQYCLKYLKSHGVLNRHLEKCLWRHPPGCEIYRKDNLSFFEVDGKFNKIYCQNLCLLAKLFLDHKTLYFDVEPFLFYILTQYNASVGAYQMVGYFSKEKQSLMNYNLSCILTLPPYMNKGYGRLLIDFSYLLSRVEGKLGSPERPLSDLGLISYRSYWKTKILSYLARYVNEAEISIKDMSLETGILTNDIISTFQFMGLIKYWKGKHVLLKNKEIINKYVQKEVNSIALDPSCLIWTPYVIQQPIINETDPLPALARPKAAHALSMASSA